MQALTKSPANLEGELFLRVSSNTNTPKSTRRVSTSFCQHVGRALTRLPPPSENIRKHQWITKVFTVGIECSVCRVVCVCRNARTCCCMYTKCVWQGGESGRHYHHSALSTIRRHLTVWDNHCRVRKVTTSTVQPQTKGEHGRGSHRSR